MMVPDEARCALHPTFKSSGTCDRCGAFVCFQCETLNEGKRFCPPCAKKMVQPLIRGSDQAYTAVVLSVLGLHCMFPLGLIGLALAYMEQGRIDRGEAPEAGRGLVRAAKVCGVICAVLCVFSVAGVAAIFAFRK